MQVEYVGMRVAVPENTMCANHPELEAIRGYVTSTEDGCHEYVYLCDECGIAHQIKLDSLAMADDSYVGDCEWCKATNVRVFETRDIEEGSSGCVYDVCQQCIKQQNDALAREEEIYRREHGLPSFNSELLIDEEEAIEHDQDVEDDDVKYLSNGD